MLNLVGARHEPAVSVGLGAAQVVGQRELHGATDAEGTVISCA
jgi:hypothetical protein